MKAALQIIAFLVLLATIFLWLGAGAHRGWSQTRVPRTSLDEITGIEAIVYDHRFVPGLDFLGAGALAAGVIAAASLIPFKPRVKSIPGNPS